jgi:hypothetical protein
MTNQFKGFGNQLQGYQNQLGALAPNFNKFLGAGSALSQAYTGTIAPTLRSGGLPTGDQLNAYIQQGRITGQQSGSLHDPSAYITDYTSRKAATDANFNQALQQSQNVLGQQSGAAAGREAITGQQAGLTGQRAGLIGQLQATQNNALNQLVGTGNAAVSQFGGLTNPILSYIQGIFGGNQQAAIAQAQVNAQQNAASSGKTGGAIGAGGSILGALIPVIASL